MTAPLIEVRNLRKAFPITEGLLLPKKIGEIRAIDDVSFDIFKGETLGAVGGSGSGKSCLGKLLLGLMPPDGGSVHFKGENMTALTPEAFRPYRRYFQIIFQDPLQSLNPRRTVAENISLPLRNFGASPDEAFAKVRELLDTVGLNAKHANRYPHQFSGGQCQRIGIARALALQPEFLFLDEPVSALDVSIQAQILNLLQDLQKQFGLTYFFVANDLKTVRHISNRILILYQGKVVELGDSAAVYSTPCHPFTQGFLMSILHMESDDTWKRMAMQSESVAGTERADSVHAAAQARTGCVFYGGCPKRLPRCQQEEPQWKDISPVHKVACHLF